MPLARKIVASFPRPTEQPSHAKSEHAKTEKAAQVDGFNKPPSLVPPAAPSVPTDADLATIARQHWDMCGYAQLRLITCECNDGVVVIRGTVSSFYLKQMAQEQVRTMQGVKQIVNELEVCSPRDEPKRCAPDSNDGSLD